MPIEILEEKTAMREVERKPHASEAMRVRCPHCRKLYMVQFADVKEAKPRFECVQCHSRFWLAMNETDFTGEVIGIPVQFKEPPRAKAPVKPAAGAETQPCPKCFKPVQGRTGECPHCGVLVQRVKELNFEEKLPPHSPELAAAWRKVVSDYGSEALHADFIRLAQRDKNLAFAATQYGQMQKLMPMDEITLRRLREVQALGYALLPDVKATPSHPYARIWQVPLAAATMMMLVGFAFPVFRNMVGAGAAILFIAVAIRIQNRRRA